MAFTYFLRCADDTYYTGSTWDLLARLRQHQSGYGASYTKQRLPVRLIYYQEFERVEQAFWREKKIQGWTQGKKRMLARDGPGVRVEDDRCLFGAPPPESL